MMLVSGVRRSWETARKRLARIRSFSASLICRSRSAISCSCFFSRMIAALARSEIVSIKIKVIGYPFSVKFSAK